MEADEIYEFLTKYNKGVKQVKFNQFQAKPTYYKMTCENAQIINEIYFKLRSTTMNTIIRTPSRGISTNTMDLYNNSYAYDVLSTSTMLRITALIYNTLFVFTFGRCDNKQYKEEGVRPIDAWFEFCYTCKKYGINLDDYIIDNGAEVRKEIQKPLIYFKEEAYNNIYENAHHIDFHNSYPAGLVNKHPEFKDPVTELYDDRKNNPKYKAVLNYSISGCMQSPKSPWKSRWAHLCKDAIDDNIDRLTKLAFRLELEGRTILGFNTDGVWYTGDIYHSEGEGHNLGEWENDHINCKLRAKSNGAYEYIENGIYNPVLRGTTNYELEVPRELWQWGDIYKAGLLVFRFDDEKGVIYNEV